MGQAVNRAVRRLPGRLRNCSVLASSRPSGWAGGGSAWHPFSTRIAVLAIAATPITTKTLGDTFR